jgi:hypothetical protein
MKLDYSKSSKGYYLILQYSSAIICEDRRIIETLKITYEQFENILRSHNAFFWNSKETNWGEGFYFQYFIDVQNAIRELEPYLILAQLLE